MKKSKNIENIPDFESIKIKFKKENFRVGNNVSTYKIIEEYIKELVKNKSLSKEKKRKLENIAQYYFDFKLPEFGKDWCEIYVLSLSEEEDLLSLWNNYSNREGYNIGFDKKAFFNKLNQLNSNSNYYYDTYYHGSVNYNKNKFYENIADLCSKFENNTFKMDEYFKNNKENKVDNKLTVAELKYVLLTYLMVKSVFVKKEGFSQEKEYRIAFIIFNDKVREQLKKKN